jgi:hypothetical protein
LTIQELASTDPTDDVVASEVFRNVSTDPASRYVQSVLDNPSTLARVAPASRVPAILARKCLPAATMAGELEFTDYEGSPGQRTDLLVQGQRDNNWLVCVHQSMNGSDFTMRAANLPNDIGLVIADSSIYVANHSGNPERVLRDISRNSARMANLDIAIV